MKPQQTILESVVEQQRLLKLVEDDLLLAKEKWGQVREKYMRRVISRLATLDTNHWSGLSEWWKSEHFKRLWVSGFCFSCSGEGKTRRGKCSNCHGKGRVAPRKPKGDMIPAGWKGSPEDAKTRK